MDLKQKSSTGIYLLAIKEVSEYVSIQRNQKDKFYTALGQL